ncbi:MAG: uracil-DNA glycosylase [Treponema sp.]|nr:uracil-DNA glycosylase [Treponema sp.]
MTFQEKTDVYNLLKAAASSVLGCESEDFSSGMTFEDDIEEISSVDAVQENKPLLNLAQKMSACRNCPLSMTRTNAVPGEGSESPLVMVIGEGPGEDEDKTGRPFVGKAGQLLDKMLSAISLDRKRNCYIANIVKCRPPNNRTPFPQEAEACSGYLQAQIHILKPKAILAMGRTAVQNLMKTDEGINALRGKILDLNGIPLLATYHPSALLRNEDLKRPAWNDLKAFRSKLLEICPDYESAGKETGL